MKRIFLLLPILLIATIVISSTGVSRAESFLFDEAGSSSFLQQATCATGICDKSGINTAWLILEPREDYLRMQQDGMGWVLEMINRRSHVNSTIEAARRAHERDLNFMILVYCDLNGDCRFSDPADYVYFIQQVAAQVEGDIWVVAGPIEPESLGLWVADANGNGEVDAADVAVYMNAVIDGVADLPNVHTVSPGFNLSHGITHTYFTQMENAGARFAELDALGGTSYTVAGNGAYYYYAANSGHAETMRQKAIRYNKPFIFLEYGTFSMLGKVTPEERAPVVQQMQSEFRQASNDPTVIGILHFNAFDYNPEFSHHSLYDSEIVEITRNANCPNGGYHEAGIGLFSASTVWQYPGETACREVEFGCPYTTSGAIACTAEACIDTDADGLLGGGGPSCVRTDCNDTDPAAGLSCGGNLPSITAPWGTVNTIDADISAWDGSVWPSIVVRDDGTPLVAYYNGMVGNGGLNVLDCRTADCSVALRRELTLDYLSGQYTTLLQRQDGLPLTSHLNTLVYQYKGYDCFDTGCESGSNNLIKGSNAGMEGYSVSVTLRNDGTPIYAFWHSFRDELGIYDCLNTNCTLYNQYWPDLDAGSNPTIAIGAGGNPVIAYYSLGLNELRFFACGDPACATGQMRVLDADGMTFTPHGMVVRADGRPFIVYRRASGALMGYDCLSADCASGNAVTLYAGSGESAYASSILMLDGNPFIAFAENMNGADYDLRLLRCLDDACSQMDSSSYTAGNAGAQPDIAMNPDGNLKIVFHDVANSDLLLYDVDLSQNGPPTVTPETPTVTPETPTATPETPTATPETPTATPETPTATPETPTVTPETPTVTPETPTVTPETPTATPETPTATPETPDEPQTIEELIDLIRNNAFQMPGGLRMSLLMKLRNAARLHANGSDTAAANLLKAFINEVEAQSGKKLSQEDADTLVAYASSLLAGLVP